MTRPHAGRAARPAVLAGAALALALLLPGTAPAHATSSSPSPAAASSGPSTTSSTAGASSAGTSAAITFGVGPTYPKGSAPRTQLQYTVAPGGAVADSVWIYNYSDRGLNLRVYCQDAFNNEQGSLAIRTGSDKPSGIGAWGALSTYKKVGVVFAPARSRIVVPFRLEVPEGAQPGDHWGAVVVALPVKQTTGGNTVVVEQRSSTLVKARVTGTVRAELQVTGLGGSYAGVVNPAGRGQATVAYTIANTGNVALAASQKVVVHGPFGFESTVSPPDVPVLLPGGSARVTQDIADVPPFVRLTADVHVVPASAANDPLAAQVDQSASFWAVPWPLLALLLTLVLLGYLTTRVVRERRRRDALRRGRHGSPVPDMARNSS